MKNIKYIKNNINKMKVTILGAGISGIGAAELASFVGAQVFISDIKKNINEQNLKNMKYEIGKHSSKCTNCDFVIKSPGIDSKISIIKKIISKNIPIISEIEFASWFTNSPIIGITGSNGKSTTVKILFDIFKKKFNQTLIGGNIGVSFSANVKDELEKRISNTYHILELSSFQLEYIYTFSPIVACILNISKDHMDRYHSIKDYINAKLNIIKYIKSDSFIIYNDENKYLSDFFNKSHNIIPFSLYNEKNNYFISNNKIITKETKKPLLNCHKIKLKGKHNYQNIIAAIQISKLFDINNIIIKKTIENFQPLKHRMENVPTVSKILFINDSKGTNISSTLHAIQSSKKSTILILGGHSKGKTNYNKLINPLFQNIKHIVCYGKEGKNIYNQISKKIKTTYIADFTKCIIFAIKLAKDNDRVLLSPACSSYDQFNNFEERGEKFKDIINNYHFA